MSTTNERSSNDIVVGNGSTTIIPFQFNWTELDPKIEIVVTTIDTTTEVKTVLVEGTDYDIVVVSIPLAITEPSIVLEDPLPVGTNLLIERKITNIQDLDYDPLSPFPADTHERLVDRVFMSLSELKNSLARLPQFDKFVTGLTNLVLPQPEDGKLLAWNGTTGELVNTDGGSGGGGAVDSVAGKTGDVILEKADITDFSDADYATAAQGALASTAVQPAGIANFETTTQLNTRDTDNRNRANHTGTQALSTLAQSGAATNDIVQWNGSVWTPVALGAGTGDVVGPASSTNDTIPLFNGTSGKLIKASASTLASVQDRANHTGTQTLSTISQSGAIAYGDVPTWNLSNYIPLHPVISRRCSKLGFWAGISGGTTINGENIGTPTAIGTATTAAPSVSATQYAQVVPRLEYAVTVASTSAIAGFRYTQNWIRIGGSSLPMTGFYFQLMFGTSRGSASNATKRVYAGLTSATAVPTDANPSTTLADLIGVGADSTDTNLQFMTRQGSGTTVKTDTGFAKASADNENLFVLDIFSEPNAGTTTMRLRRLSTGTFFDQITHNPLSSDLPTTGVFLGPRLQASVGGTSSVIGTNFYGLYLEQFYSSGFNL
jgi:hypothetical protein